MEKCNEVCVTSHLPFWVTSTDSITLYKQRNVSLSVVIAISDVIMSAMSFRITGVSIVCSAVCSGSHQIQHKRSASLAFVRGIHRWPMDSPHKGPVTRKMFPFDYVIMMPTGVTTSVFTVETNIASFVYAAPAPKRLTCLYRGTLQVMIKHKIHALVGIRL